MSGWLANHWWLAWAFVVVGGLVAVRMRRRGGDEPVLRRLMYALFPVSDPAIRKQRHVSAFSGILLGGGLGMLMIAFILLTQSR